MYSGTRKNTTCVCGEGQTKCQAFLSGAIIGRSKCGGGYDRCMRGGGIRKSQTESGARAIEGTVGHLNLPICSLKQGTPIWTGYNIYLKLVSLLVLAGLSGTVLGCAGIFVRFWAWRFGGGGYDRCMRGGAYASFRQSSGT